VADADLPGGRIDRLAAGPSISRCSVATLACVTMEVEEGEGGAFLAAESTQHPHDSRPASPATSPPPLKLSLRNIETTAQLHHPTVRPHFVHPLTHIQYPLYQYSGKAATMQLAHSQRRRLGPRLPRQLRSQYPQAPSCDRIRRRGPVAGYPDKTAPPRR